MPNPVAIDKSPGRFSFQMTFVDAGAAAADIASLGEKFAAFLAESGVNSDNINSLHVATEELLTNLAKFGDVVNADPASAIRADGVAEIGGTEIVLRLTDNAKPFDPSKIPPPAIDGDPMERDIGGLGIFMLFQMFKELRYRHVDGGNVSEWVLERSPAPLGARLDS